MLKIRLLDDLHTEFGAYQPAFRVKADVCLLAGDIGIAPSVELLETVLNVAKQHDMTILVPGNHEYYNGEVHASNHWMHTTLKKAVADHGAYLEVFAPHGYVEFGGVPFVGGTLWTDFNKYNYVDMHLANSRMNDFRLIRHEVDGRVVSWVAEDAYNQNQATRAFMAAKLTELNDSKTVIVTHHAPLNICAEEQFRTNRLNSAYCNTGLDDWFFDKEFAVWCHGHCHNSNRLEVNDRAILSNARGYVGHAVNPLFDSEFVFEV